MSQIRGKDTNPEKLLRSVLWRMGVRFRIHTGLPGRPDIVLSRPKIAIFVDGCFWHSCPQHGSKPKTNSEFWQDKLAKTVERDRRVTRELQDEGWQVVRVWEHQVKDDVIGLAESIVRQSREVRN